MPTTRHLTPGTYIRARQLTTMTGAQVPLPDPDRLVHLQFRRFAGCPVCNLHLRSITTQLDTIEAAGVREIVVFHSTTEDLLQYEADLPFPVIADPKKRLYAEFGVDTAARALLDPRAYLPMLRGLAHDIWSVLRRRKGVPSLRQDNGFLGLPADLLIAPDGRIVIQTQAMPGFTNKILYTFHTPGTYRIMCLEYCGVAHNGMTAEFDVAAPGDKS